MPNEITHTATFSTNTTFWRRVISLNLGVIVVLSDQYAVQDRIHSTVRMAWLAE